MFRLPPISSSTDILIHTQNGCTYRRSQILDYIQQQQRYPAVFCEFGLATQNTHHPLHLFTLHDVMALMQDPLISEAIETHERFQRLRAATTKLSMNAVRMIRELADAAECQEDLFTLTNSLELGEELSIPLFTLFDYLEERSPQAEKDRRILAEITCYRGPLSTYSLARGQHLITDLQAIIHERKCSAGLNRALADVYTSLQSCKLYELYARITDRVQLNVQNSARLFHNKRRRPDEVTASFPESEEVNIVLATPSEKRLKRQQTM